MDLGILLYVIALLAQVTAALYALNLFLRSKSYRLASGFLLFGLVLMIGRRLSPIIYALSGVRPNLIDAFLAVPISFFLLLGMIQFKKLLIDLEEKNFVLDLSSKTDALTSAMSRVESFARANLEIKKAFRNKKSVSFLMLDIDHFKLVNDTYGHPTGDLVLIELVKTCLEELREIDIFGRVGGEEFLIVLPETEREGAIEIAERLRASIENTSFRTTTGTEISITISIGAAIYNPNNDEEDDSAAIVKKYYAACDKAMYHAKSAGRNQTYCSGHFI